MRPLVILPEMHCPECGNPLVAERLPDEYDRTEPQRLLVVRPYICAAPDCNFRWNRARAVEMSE